MLSSWYRFATDAQNKIPSDGDQNQEEYIFILKWNRNQLKVWNKYARAQQSDAKVQETQ